MKTIRIMIASSLALIMALASIPAAALTAHIENTAEPCWTVPSGYNQHDYNKVAAFLELRDENGVRNGEKCGTNYNPSDPTTWGRTGSYDDPDNYDQPTTFTWTEAQTDRRIMEISCFSNDLVGSFDLSGCTELLSLNCASNRISALNVSQCSNLASLTCSGNSISSLNVSSNPQLNTLVCNNNALTTLSLSANEQLRYLSVSNNALGSLNLSALTNLLMLNCGNCGISSLNLSAQSRLLGLYCPNNSLSAINLSQLTRLQYVNVNNNNLSQLNVSANTIIIGINCDDNDIQSLNLSANTMLSYLSCRGNRLTDIDLSATRVGINRVRAENGGTVGCSIAATALVNEYMPELDNTVCAVPASGYSFAGWFNAAGASISNDPVYAITATSETVFNARFTDTSSIIPGDVDGDGEVTISDAIAAMRAGMGVIQLTGDALIAGDMNNDGTIAIDDAMTIMRIAMGLI